MHTWDERTGTWMPQEARELAEFLIELADKVEREAPEVRVLVNDLEAIEVEADYGEPTFEDMALGLFRKGYRK